jgi:predicted porin
MQRRTYVRLHYFFDKERIRPVDFEGLKENVDFDTSGWSVGLTSSYFKEGTIELSYGQNQGINFEPPQDALPYSADETSFSAEMRLRPLRRLQMRNFYLYTGLKTKEGSVIFNDHIVSVRTNYQFTKALSLRLIVQYEATIVNSDLTSLEDRRNLNGDVLVTYMVNPWTALYVGYNGNRQNLSFIDDINPPSVIRTHGTFMNDANQFFMKFSYLLHF